MLKLEDLSGLSFEEMVEAAKKQLAYLYPEWTFTGASDPGVTLIELFAWLKTMQHGYMNKVLNAGQLKLLKLLDVEPRLSRAAQAPLALSGLEEDILLPIGTRFYSEELCFENSAPVFLVTNSVVRYQVRDADGQKLADIAPESLRALAVFGEDPASGNSFTLHLQRPLPAGQPLSLGVRLAPAAGRQRNPLPENHSFAPLFTVQWQYYGEQQGIIGWHEATILRDATCGFLFPGLIQLQIAGQHLQQEGGYPLRAVYMGGDYDFPPRIAAFYLNYFTVEQKQTYCEHHLLDVKNRDNRSFTFYSRLAAEGSPLLFMRREHGYTPLDTNLYQVEQEPQTGKARLTVKRQAGLKKGSQLLAMFYDPEMRGQLLLGSGTGISHQTVKLPIKDIHNPDFALLVGEEREGQMYFSPWVQVRDFFSSDKEDCHYMLDLQEELIRFGDHIHGKAPAAAENSLLVCGLSLCRQDGGNVQAGRVGSVKSQLAALADITVLQIEAASGGAAPETLDDAKARVSLLFDERQNLVTLADYQNMAVATPGLIINNVKVLGGFDPNKTAGEDMSNDVTLVVEGPASRQKGLSSAYRKNMRAWLEQGRLLGTEIHITSPDYVGVIINGSVVLKPYYKNARETVTSAIGRFVEELNHDFGQTLFLGDLYGFVDMLECVAEVHNLTIEPYGNYVEKTKMGDIRVPPGGGYYLRGCELVFSEARL